MVSYWKLINMKTAKVIALGKIEKPLIELKLTYENKFNTPTKMVKCFGQDKYDKDRCYLDKMYEKHMSKECRVKHN